MIGVNQAFVLRLNQAFILDLKQAFIPCLDQAFALPIRPPFSPAPLRPLSRT